LQAVSPTLATQLSQLPIASAVSGIGLVFKGPVAVETGSLGTILTQRGETIGKHKKYLSFNYQRFSFDSIEGVDLGRIPLFNQVDQTGGATLFQQTLTSMSLTVDQFTFLGSYGLTDSLDISLVLPFSRVQLGVKTIDPTNGEGGYHYYTSFGSSLTANGYSPGSFLNGTTGEATGIGDVIAIVKDNIWKSQSEHTNLAIGAEVRFPTGDAVNYLGSGAYGFKPYIILSHNGKVTPNVNIGYQWNSESVLNPNAAGHSQNLPSALLYSGGIDFRVNKKLGLVTEFLGQFVRNGNRLALLTTSPFGTPFRTVSPYQSSYNIDNGSVGLKFSPTRRLLITGSALFKLDNAGLRSNVVPLIGASYSF
jgi:hypothetical protein